MFFEILKMFFEVLTMNQSFFTGLIQTVYNGDSPEAFLGIILIPKPVCISKGKQPQNIFRFRRNLTYV